MSLRGRYMIDRIKRMVGRHLRLPVPPYGDPDYWEESYKSFGPNDVLEWGDFGLDDLLQYSYTPLGWDTFQFPTTNTTQSTIATSQ